MHSSTNALRAWLSPQVRGKRRDKSPDGKGGGRVVPPSLSEFGSIRNRCDARRLPRFADACRSDDASHRKRRSGTRASDRPPRSHAGQQTCGPNEHEPWLSGEGLEALWSEAAASAFSKARKRPKAKQDPSTPGSCRPQPIRSRPKARRQLARDVAVCASSTHYHKDSPVSCSWVKEFQVFLHAIKKNTRDT